MQASVKIMDIDVDMLTNDIFTGIINEHLSDGHLYVIFFASAELLDRASKDEDYREIIEQADLLLPGEEALLATHHVDVLEAGGMVTSFKSFGLVLENLQRQDRNIYIMAKSEEEAFNLRDCCKRVQPGLKVVDFCVYGGGLDDEAVINDINSCLPDMLVVDLPPGIQERWIIGHASQLNAKICIATGGVSGLVLAGEKVVPVWAKKLHLTWLYEKIVRQQSVKKSFRARIFRKKIVQYNNQSEEPGNNNDNGD